jgi:hypothetical protein
MLAKDVEALAHAYCQRGVSVQFHEYRGLDRGQLFAPFSAGAVAFLAERLHGQRVAEVAVLSADEPPRPTEAVGDLATP